MMESQLDELLPLLSEQLRKQLSTISAAVQLISTPVLELNEPRYDECLAVLNQSLYRIIRTLNDLDFAQLPEGAVVLKQENIDLIALCRCLLHSSADLAASMGVTLEAEPRLEGLHSLPTRGDPALLRRMLFHLLSNALRAAAQGGQAGISISRRRSCAVLTIWDTGPGLQLPPDTPLDALIPRPEGLGLGVSIARRIARLHDGTLVFEQRENRGVRAVVSLPIQPLQNGGLLRSPSLDNAGGFRAALIELSSILPYQAFSPRDIE